MNFPLVRIEYSKFNQIVEGLNADIRGALNIPWKRFALGVFCFSASLLCSTGIRAAIVIRDPGSVVAGKSIGEWSAEQWKWTFGFSVPTDPFSDATGSFANLNQSGPVFFVAGNLGASSPRSFVVPADTYLLFPLLVGELSQLELGFGKTSAEVLAATVDQANLIDELHASVDGVDIPNLFSYREVSPEFNYTAAANNPIGVSPGDSGIAFADGYWLMVAPIPVGETHVFKFGGGISSFDFRVDQTATITAVPEPSSMLHIGMCCFVHFICRRSDRGRQPRQR